jgi:hypothetical protein
MLIGITGYGFAVRDDIAMHSDKAGSMKERDSVRAPTSSGRDSELLLQ